VAAHECRIVAVAAPVFDTDQLGRLKGVPNIRRGIQLASAGKWIRKAVVRNTMAKGDRFE